MNLDFYTTELQFVTESSIRNYKWGNSGFGNSLTLPMIALIYHSLLHDVISYFTINWIL